MSPHTVKVLEVGELNSLAHPKHVSGAAEAVEKHPHITRIEGRDLGRGLIASVTEVLKSVLDICPCGDDGADNHETE